MKLRIGILSLILFITLTSLTYSITRASFTDSASSLNNSFTAAEFFPRTASLFDSDAFTCPTGATDTTINRGSVKISRNEDNLDIEVTITGGTPNTAFDLWVNQDPGGCPQSVATFNDFLTTDSSGNGTATLSGHDLVSGATNFWVSMVAGAQVYRSTAVTFGDSTGSPTGTGTGTPTPTISGTGTSTPTGSFTPTPTNSLTPTNTPTLTPTNTPTATPTNSPSPTATNTPTPTPTPVDETTLSFNPSGGSVNQGGVFAVTVMVDSDSEQYNTIQADVTYPTSKITGYSIATDNPGNSDMTLAFELGSTPGNIRIIGGTSTLGTGSRRVAKITFNVSPSATGTISLGFAGTSAVVGTGPTNLLDNTSGATWTVNE